MSENTEDTTRPGRRRVSARQSSSFAAFEKVLADRAKVSPEVATEFAMWSETRLGEEVDRVTSILKRFAETVANALSGDDHTNEFLAELDLELIERDHNWRDIFATIRKQSNWTPQQKRSVMGKYLQFLGFRKRLLEYIIERKDSLDRTNQWSLMELGGKHVSTEGYIRIPEGEAISVTLPSNRTVSIMLAMHRFTLIGGQPAQLIDENGVSYKFKPGKNLVGRHSAADIEIPQLFPYVSRAHLMVQWVKGRRVSLTDLSSGGTYIAEGTEIIEG